MMQDCKTNSKLLNKALAPITAVLASYNTIIPMTDSNITRSFSSPE